MTTDIAEPETPGTDLATPVTGSALTEGQEAAVKSAALDDLGDDGLTLPMLKLTQQLSKDVTAGGKESGHYINALTGEDYGDHAELIVVYTAKGRFLSDRASGNTYSAFGETVPANWPAKYAGKRFEDLPDAEETYAERANNDPDFEWGSGPKIQTTRNFVGFLASDFEAGTPIPVRLSLKSTGTPVAKKIGSILRWALKAPWYNVIELGVSAETDTQDNPYYVTTAERGRKTTDEERDAANELHASVLANLANLRLVGEDDDRKRAPAPEPDGDALAVS